MKVIEFLDYLRCERNYSERTVKEYGDDLTHFESFFKKFGYPALLGDCRLRCHP